MTNPKITHLTPAEAASRADLIIVDVRSADERSEACAPGTAHIPLDEVEARLGELPHDHTLAFICGSGARSSKAAAIAADRGRNVANVQGGMRAWVDAGLPTLSGEES